MMKPSLLLVLPAAAIALTSCTTLQNRRDLYSPQQVNGPYTQMVKNWNSVQANLNKVPSVPKGGKPASGKNYVAPEKK